MLSRITEHKFWRTHGLLLARVIMGALFIFAAYNKFIAPDMTATYIQSAGFPAPQFLTWVAAFFEVALAIGFITGFHFKLTALLAAIYALFLGFAFHGPSHWGGNPAEFGFFIDHFVMFAGLLYMIGHGTGESWKLKK